jgi:hypothetical protein
MEETSSSKSYVSESAFLKCRIHRTKLRKIPSKTRIRSKRAKVLAEEQAYQDPHLDVDLLHSFVPTKQENLRPPVLQSQQENFETSPL